MYLCLGVHCTTPFNPGFNKILNWMTINCRVSDQADRRCWAHQIRCRPDVVLGRIAGTSDFSYLKHKNRTTRPCLRPAQARNGYHLSHLSHLSK